MLNHSPNLPKPIPQIPKGYEWKVINDPTRSGDEPGLFYGKLFRMIDLRLDRDEKSTWPDGIRFEHILTGQRLTFDQGRLIDLANQACLNRKSRSQTRKEKMLSKPAPHPSQMRRFILFRTIDPTGVSGTGVVAEGLVFTDGLSILHWVSDPHATGIYPSLEDILSVHGHEGCTRIHFLDRAEILPIPQDFLK